MCAALHRVTETPLVPWHVEPHSGSDRVIDHYIDGLRDRRDQVAERIRQAILEETPAYRALEGDEATAWATGVHRALGMFVEGGIAGRELTEVERTAMEAIGRARAEQGMPLDAISASIAVAARVVRDWALLRPADGTHDERRALTVFSERVTTFANRITSAALRAYVARKEELATSLEQARARLFDRLLGGRVQSQEAAVREGHELGCDLTIPWALVLLPAAGLHTPDRLEVDALAAVAGSVIVPMGTTDTPHAVLAVPVHQHDAGSEREAVVNVVHKHNISVLWTGPSSGIDALPRAYRSARALVPYVDGLASPPAVVDVADHREAALLATVPHELRDGYVTDVLGGIEREPRPRARRLLRTLEVLVQTESLKAAANALGVNVKTVRRRIEQVERLSGLRLDRPADVHRARTALTLRRLSTVRALSP